MHRVRAVLVGLAVALWWLILPVAPAMGTCGLSFEEFNNFELKVEPPKVAEGHTVTATITRSNAAGPKTQGEDPQGVLVWIYTRNISAIAGDDWDYKGLAEEVDFPPDYTETTTRTLSIPIYADRWGEPDETFEVIISAGCSTDHGSAMSGPQDSKVVTIAANEPTRSPHLIGTESNDKAGKRPPRPTSIRDDDSSSDEPVEEAADLTGPADEISNELASDDRDQTHLATVVADAQPEGSGPLISVVAALTTVAAIGGGTFVWRRKFRPLVE